MTRATGSALRSRVRACDVVARLGGDEFAVLLKNVDRAEAEQIAQVMLESVRARELPIDGRRTTITTSIGVALFDDDVIVAASCRGLAKRAAAWTARPSRPAT